MRLFNKIINVFCTTMLFTSATTNMIPAYAASAVVSTQQEIPAFGKLEDVINNPDNYIASELVGYDGNKFYRIYGKPVFNNENDLILTRRAYSYRYSGAGPLSFADRNNELFISSRNITNEYKQKNNAVYSYARDFANTLTGMSDKEKVDAIVNHLYNAGVYDDTTNPAINKPAYAYAYDLLFDHHGCCAAFANAFCIFCDAAGLDSKYVIGSNTLNSTVDNHGWNIVMINGVPQDIDISRARVFNNINDAYINASTLYTTLYTL